MVGGGGSLAGSNSLVALAPGLFAVGFGAGVGSSVGVSAGGGGGLELPPTTMGSLPESPFKNGNREPPEPPPRKNAPPASASRITVGIMIIGV
jgi:hypothetical protein